jgi:stage V sporulation protein AE
MIMEYLIAFIIGGLICFIVQILMEKTTWQPGRIMVIVVVTGSLLSALGIYEPFSEWAGAGANVPLLGFGNVLYKGVKEAVDENGFLGIFLGGFQAGAAGISAALIFGYIASLVADPKIKS